MVGGGPAGLAAAIEAASAGARTIVLERGLHPRYKTCGGGLIGTSLAVAGTYITVPARDQIGTATVTLAGRRPFTRTDDRPLLAMVTRDEFDDALRRAARRRPTPAHGWPTAARSGPGSWWARMAPPGYAAGTWGCGAGRWTWAWNWNSR